jgi:hypothetical protein
MPKGSDLKPIGHTNWDKLGQAGARIRCYLLKEQHASNSLGSLDSGSP